MKKIHYLITWKFGKNVSSYKQHLKKEKSLTRLEPKSKQQILLLCMKFC